MSVNIVYALANLLGPGLGGWFTDHGPLLAPAITATTRWRWIFYLNLPLGIIALTTLFIFLPATLSERSHHLTGREALRRIDVTGALLCAGATTCLLLGLTWGSSQSYTWDSLQVGGMLAAAVILLLLFLLGERRVLERYLGQVGSTLGVALVGTVVNQSLANSGRKTTDKLAVALQHGFLTVLVFCGIALLTACFLKDTPIMQQSSETTKCEQE